MTNSDSDEPKDNGILPLPDTSTAPKRKCSVPGCPTRGEVDESGTCSAHGAKRKRCKIEGCPNGVVQGGVCVKHGAKRRQCKFPGCEKNTKSHGLCSKHGPSRKRCEVSKCSNVAVRAGRCKSHGAYSIECNVLSCTKQAVSAGLCMRHWKERSATAAAQNALHFPQMMAAQGAQGMQVPVAGFGAMNPNMNASAVGMMPMQQSMGMQLPLQFLSSQMGMTNQMCLPSQSQMPMGIPSQMQMGLAYPVNGLPVGMGAQAMNDTPPSTSGDGQDSNGDSKPNGALESAGTSQKAGN